MAKNTVPPLSETGNSSTPAAVRVTPLITVFERLGDWRKAKGKVYPLPALLVLVLTGLLCGMEGPTAIAEWAAELPWTVRVAMGLPWNRRASPMMVCRLCWHLDADALEVALQSWSAEVNAQLAQQGDSRRLAVDGKTLRGAANRGARMAHLLAAVSHQLKTVWGEVPVDQKTNEIPLFSALLRLLAVKGYLLTMDALLTQRDIAQQIIDSGNDYLMVVKDNQPQLLADIQGCFEAEPLADEVRGQAQTTTKDHGRLEVRTIVTSTALNEYLDWPGVAQVAQISRTISNMRSRTSTWEQVYAITSLPPDRSTRPRLRRVISRLDVPLRQVFIEAVDDGGMVSARDSLRWYVRSPGTGGHYPHQARLLLIDDMNSGNAVVDGTTDSIYVNTARRNLAEGEYSILRMQFTQPFRSGRDVVRFGDADRLTDVRYVIALASDTQLLHQPCEFLCPSGFPCQINQFHADDRARIPTKVCT